MELGQAASSRIEALLQRVLDKVDGLEHQVASHNSKLEDVQNELRAVDAKLEVVRAEVEAVRAEVAAPQDVTDAF